MKKILSVLGIVKTTCREPPRGDSEEGEVIRRHPALGYGLVRDVKLVREVGNIILCHHEKYDGTGYPKGLKGEAIPLEARVFAVTDTLDAVTSHRPYRAPRDFRAARRELVGNAGRQFDPKVVDVFCGMDLAVWEKIRFETTRLLPPPHRRLPGIRGIGTDASPHEMKNATRHSYSPLSSAASRATGSKTWA